MILGRFWRFVALSPVNFIGDTSGKHGVSSGPACALALRFIGAGVIMHHNREVLGLSTAATFWAVAAIGTASGLLEYSLALALTAIVFFAHSALRKVSIWIEHVAPPEDSGPR